MKDDVIVRKLEADLASEYNVDLRDLWRPGSGLTVRRVIVLLLELPDDSRTKKHIAGDKAVFGITDHLLADIRDLLNVAQYFSGVTATKDMQRRSDINKVVRGMPKRIRRPGDPEPEVKFATPEQLKMLFPASALAKRQRRKGLSSGNDRR